MQCASATFCTVARRLRAFPVVSRPPDRSLVAWCVMVLPMLLVSTPLVAQGGGA